MDHVLGALAFTATFIAVLIGIPSILFVLRCIWGVYQARKDKYGK